MKKRAVQQEIEIVQANPFAFAQAHLLKGQQEGLQYRVGHEDQEKRHAGQDEKIAPLVAVPKRTQAPGHTLRVGSIHEAIS